MTHKIAIPHATIRDAIDWKDVHEDPPGTLAPGRIPVIRKDGVRVGHVSHHAGAAVAMRLLGSNRGAALGELHGKPAWIEKNDPVAVATKVSAVSHAKNVKSARGSVRSKGSRS